MSIWSNIYFPLQLDSTSHTYFIICNKNTNNIPSQIFEFSLKLQCVVVSSITGGLYKKQFPVEFYYTARWRELSKATLQTGLSSLSLWEIIKLLLVSKLKPFLLGERSSDRNWKPSNTSPSSSPHSVSPPTLWARHGPESVSQSLPRHCSINWGAGREQSRVCLCKYLSDSVFPLVWVFLFLLFRHW